MMKSHFKYKHRMVQVKKIKIYYKRIFKKKEKEEDPKKIIYNKK
jgi:hypothetical protein